MRYLTTAQLAQLQANAASPVILVALTHRAPGISRNLYYSSRQVTGEEAAYTVGGTEYKALMSRGGIPSITWQIPFIGGLGSIHAATIALAGIIDNNTLWLDELDNGSLVGAEAEFSLIFVTGSEGADDIVPLASGVFQRMDGANMARVPLTFNSRLFRPGLTIPSWSFEAADFPFADLGLYEQPKPVVFGDCTGSRFDVSTPSDEEVPHLPLPLVSGMDQKYWLFDDDDSSGQETLVNMGGVLCTIDSGDVTVGSGVLQIDGDHFIAWVRPHRLNANTDANVTNPEYARSGDLDEYAHIEDDADNNLLQVDFPGLPASLGIFGDAAVTVAADVVFYAIYSTSASSDVDVYPYVDGALAGTLSFSTSQTKAVLSSNEGNHFNEGWDDTVGMSLQFDCNVDYADIHRALIAVHFRSTELLAAWEQQKLYRSMLGFTESSSAATDDYANGGYITPPGTSRISTPLGSPMDQAEAALRNVNWGMKLRAPEYADSIGTGVVLAEQIGNETTFQLGANDCYQITQGMDLICDYETMRVTRHPNICTYNSGFETGDLTDWPAWGSPTTREVIAGAAYEGTYGYNHNGASDNVGSSHGITLEPNTTYTLSCWAKCSTQNGTARIMAIYTDASGAKFPQEVFTANNTWTRYSETFTTGDGPITGDGVYLGGNGNFYADDVQLTRGSTTLDYATGDQITVTRGMKGSRITCHNNGASLYDVPTDGSVDIAAFRGARELMRYPSGSNLITDGHFEATNVAGLTGWSDYDPDTVGQTALAKDGLRGNVLKCQSDSASGARPGLAFGLTLTSGSWYLFRVFLRDGSPTSTIRATTMEISDGTDTSVWSITPQSQSDFQLVEIVFKAWDTSLDVRLQGPGTIAGAPFGFSITEYDEAQCYALSDIEWKYQQSERVDARRWLDEVGRDACAALYQDGNNRITVRSPDLYRDLGSLTELTSADVKLDNAGVPRIAVSARSVDELYTGVTVEFDYDYIFGKYRRTSYVTADLTDIQQEVSSFSDPNLTVSDGSGLARIFPSGRWTSGSASVTTSGAENDTVTITGATFQTDGTEAGDWLYLQASVLPGAFVARIASVDSETAVTLDEPCQYLSAVTCKYGTFPTWYASGGSVWVPYVSGGPGAEANPFEIRQEFENDFAWNLPADADPVAGDILYKVTTGSDDGAGTQDQQYLVYNSREREAARRVAQLGYENQLRIQAPRIRDAGAAAWLRNRLFDLHYDGWIVDLATPLTRANLEVGDQVLVTHDMLPGGAQRCLIVQQGVNIAAGEVTFKMITLPEVR